MDYYEVLGVTPQADTEVIAAAYRALAKKYHPDVNSDANAHDRLSVLNEAYSVLSNEEAREAYDRSLEHASFDEVGTADLNVSVIEADSAAAVTSHRPPKQSLIGDVLFLLVVVPLFWMLSVFMAEVLFLWLIRLLLDWADSNTFTFAAAAKELINIASLRFDVWTATADQVDPNTNLGRIIFYSLWDMLLAAVATGAVLGYAADERPRIPSFLVAGSILAVFGLILSRSLGALTGSEGTEIATLEIATKAAIFTGIVFGIRQHAKGRIGGDEADSRIATAAM